MASAHPKNLYRRIEALFGGFADGDVLERPELRDDLLSRLRGELGAAALCLLRQEAEGFVVLARSAEDPGDDLGLAPGTWAPGVTVVPREQRQSRPEPHTSAAVAFRGRGRDYVLLVRAWLATSDEDLELALSVLHSVLMIRFLEDRLGDTLQQAAEIQGSLLPRAPPESAAYELAFRYEPAEAVGGDVIDFIDVDAETLALVVGDASGHGLPAALLVRDVVIGLRMGIERELKPDFVLSKLNRVIHTSTLSSSFVSLFYGELESNGNLFYFNAGHEPGLLFHGGEVELLRSRDTVVGPLHDVRFKRQFAHVDRGATLMLYTDGLVEGRSPEGEVFGLERLVSTVRSHLHETPAAVVDAVFEELERFRGSRPGHDRDDSTLLVVRRRSEPAPRKQARP